MRLRTFSTAFLCLVAASPSLAAAPAKSESKPTINVVTVSPGKASPNFAAMLGLIDKLFPPQPDPDPARLALARTSVLAMWPDGAYGKALTGLFAGVFDRAMLLKSSDFEAMGGKAPDARKAAGGADLSLHQAALAKDPYFDQRTAAMRQVLTEELAKVSAILDPKMRDGLARAMARRFDGQQLTDLNAFFATPSGRAFAGQYTQLWVDPDLIRSVFSSMPAMITLMPEIMQKVQAANDKFPKPPAHKAAAAEKGGKH